LSSAGISKSADGVKVSVEPTRLNAPASAPESAKVTGPPTVSPSVAVSVMTSGAAFSLTV